MERENIQKLLGGIEDRWYGGFFYSGQIRVNEYLGNKKMNLGFDILDGCCLFLRYLDDVL